MGDISDLNLDGLFDDTESHDRTAVAVVMSCPRFVQNAWKRDLCSNCFKGKEDHAPVVDNRARYLANLKEITKLPPPPSILKGVIRKNVSAFKVHFPNEESQVIGYGGDELSDYEEEEPPRNEENGTVEEDSTDEEEYKRFQELTESNTEFNKDPANLLNGGIKAEEKAKKQMTASLKLGQMKSASDGKKQTLLVSVQPFGSPVTSTPLAVSRKTHLNNLLHDAADSLKLCNSPETKNSVLSTAKSETETNKTEISCDNVSSPSIKCSISLPEIPHVNSIIVNSKPDCKDDAQMTEVTKIEDQHDDSIKKTEKNAENRLSSLIEGKRSHITRGTILTKSHEQVKSKRYYQVGPDSPDDDIPISESIFKKLESNSSFSKAKDTIKLKSNFQHNNVKNIANGLFSSKLLKKEFGIQSDLQLTRMKSLDYIDTNPSAISLGVGKENEPVQVKADSKILNEMSSTVLSKSSPPESPVGSPDKNEVLLIDGVPAESREMAGEPDGRADSDDTDEPPPELPTTPPPLLTDPLPRPSFLHNLIKEKPKLPSKPKLRDKSPPKDLALDLGCQSEPDPNLSPSARHSLITKRQAPKPPPTPLGESPPKGEVTPPEQSPPGRRERAASCSPLPSDSSGGSQTPEPGARRSLSLSHEALANSAPLPVLDKKKSNKMRSTLRKFLRLASRDDMKCEEVGPPPLPPPRPRPEIIHPLDLNKSAVQVLRSDGSLVPSKPASSSSDSPSSPTSPVSPSFHGRPSKPPPPPRSHSLDSALSDSRPARPPPPSTSVYVNLGEVRSSIAPAKPQRTASLREKEKDNVDSTYQSTSAMQMSENLYESLAPECDLNRERSSLPYYGSETESDIYCPYTFANSLKGEEELRSKTRSVVHKSLEDNYSAVTVANYEALSQLLEQVSLAPPVPQSLRAIKGCSSLQWTDFTVEEGGEVVGSRVFLPASWSQTPVSLCLTSGQSRLPPGLHPVTQFFDVVASQYLCQDKTELVQVSVAVLVRQQFLSLASLASQLPLAGEGEVAVRLAALVMLQVVSCLQTLQAQGSEHTSLSQLVACREDPQATPRVCLLSQPADKGSADCVSLCQCALQALDLLTLPPPLSAILRSVLAEDRSPSLTQTQATLELWLWGPTHLPVSADTQANLQRWLDLERANVLQSLAVRRPSTLRSSDYCHLSFLVKTNAKIMSDALSLLATNTST